jgi:uncharacterized protein
MNETLQEATAVLAADPAVTLAIAFGSVAAGSAGAESDVDVAVWREGAFGATEKMALIRALATATGRAIDLLDLRRTHVPLLRTILCDGVVLVKRDERLHERLVIRMLGEVEDFLPLRERLLRERRRAWTG